MSDHSVRPFVLPSNIVLILSDDAVSRSILKPNQVVSTTLSDVVTEILVLTLQSMLPRYFPPHVHPLNDAP